MPELIDLIKIPEEYGATHLYDYEALKKRLAGKIDILFSEYYENPDSPIHGREHAISVLNNILWLIELYHAYGYEEVTDLDENQVYYLAVAALLHDSGRQGEGPDLPEWERKSAENCRRFLLTEGCDPEVANIFYATIVRKDADDKKDIWTRLLHDADCLEVMRVRRLFYISKLDIYKQVRDNPFIIALLTNEVIRFRNKSNYFFCNILTSRPIQVPQRNREATTKIITALDKWKQSRTAGNLLIRWLQSPGYLNDLETAIYWLKIDITHRHRRASRHINLVLAQIQRILSASRLNEKTRRELTDLQSAISAYKSYKEQRESDKSKAERSFLDESGELTEDARQQLRSSCSLSAEQILYILAKIDKRIRGDSGCYRKLKDIYTKEALRLLRGKNPSIPQCYHMTRQKTFLSIWRQKKILEKTPFGFTPTGVYVSTEPEGEYGAYGFAISDDIYVNSISSSITRESYWRAYPDNILLADRKAVCRVIVPCDDGNTWSPRGIPQLTYNQAKIECELLKKESLIRRAEVILKGVDPGKSLGPRRHQSKNLARTILDLNELKLFDRYILCVMENDIQAVDKITASPSKKFAYLTLVPESQRQIYLERLTDRGRVELYEEINSHETQLQQIFGLDKIEEVKTLICNLIFAELYKYTESLPENPSEEKRFGYFPFTLFTRQPVSRGQAIHVIQLLETACKIPTFFSGEDRSLVKQVFSDDKLSTIPVAIIDFIDSIKPADKAITTPCDGLVQ